MVELKVSGQMKYLGYWSIDGWTLISLQLTNGLY